MYFSENEWSELVLQKSANRELAEYEIDIGLKNVYWTVDGVRPLRDIAAEDQYELSGLVAQVRQLLELGLVVVVHEKSATIDPAFLDFLSDLLARELGPMGQIILEDTVRKFGCEKSRFPASNLPKLIDGLAREIGDANKESIFKDRVSAEIQRIKQ